MKKFILPKNPMGGGGCYADRDALLDSGALKFAFTLAEVLITLGIIGIVAAMTLPTIVKKYRTIVIQTQLKKIYSVVAQAMLRAAPDGDYKNLPLIKDPGGTESAKFFFDNYLKPQFKVTKTCVDKAGCWTPSIAKDGTGASGNKGVGSGVVSFVTADGYAFSIDTWSSNHSSQVMDYFGVQSSDYAAIVAIAIDINGEKKPNVYGKDVFFYVMTERGLLPAGNDKTDDEVSQECQTIGRYCFSNVMRHNWKINEEDTF